VAQRADDIVQALAKSAASVERVIGLIGRIAGQTNLLALNASIEAARAVMRAAASRSLRRR
jgi:methyl-accepting chemotaxis protein